MFGFHAKTQGLRCLDSEAATLRSQKSFDKWALAAALLRCDRREKLRHSLPENFALFAPLPLCVKPLLMTYKSAVNLSKI